MRQLVYVAVGAAALCAPFAVLAGSGERGFDGVVHSIESQYHARATRVPMMGLISLVARGASHGAVRGMHVAEFEDFSASLDSEDLIRLTEDKLGPQWNRMVRETSSHGQSQTLIYSRPAGDRVDLFVLDADGHELDVVQISVDAAHLAQQINHYEHHHHEGGEVSD